MAVSNCIPVLDHFICGYSLKKGTGFIAWLGLGGTVLQLLISAVYLFIYGRQIPDWELLLIISVGGNAISASVYGLLLYGTYKSKPSYMLPFLILGAISIFSSAFGVIIFGIYACMYNTAVGLTILGAGGLLLVLNAYFWLVVYSYYRQLLKCLLPQHGGSVVTVLTVAESDEVNTLNKFLVQGKCDEKSYFTNEKN